MQSLHRRGTCGRIALVALFFLLLQLPPAAAKEPDEADGFEVRIFRVGSLTAGRGVFIGEHRPPVGPDDVTNENSPLFGRIEEDRDYPFGDMDDVIALLRGLSTPEAWKDEKSGAYMVTLGEHCILAKNRPKELDALARVIADLERRALSTVTVEVQAVRVPAGGEVAGDAVAPPGRQDERSGPSLTLVGFLGQRISGFNGGQSAYVQDFDVEVAKEATASDPIVSVANLGLRADVRVLPTAGGRRLLLDVRAWHAAVGAAREVATGSQRPIESRDFDVAAARGVVEAPPGVWTIVAGRGSERGWSFFVRATPHAWEAAPAKPTPLSIPAPTGAPRVQALHDVRDLALLVPPRRSDENNLVPSNFTPPEQPELPEPTATLETRDLIFALKYASPLGAWAKPAMNDVSAGTLYVRNAPNVLAGVAKALTAIRRQYLVSVHTRAELVELPAALLDRLCDSDVGGASVHVKRAALDRALKDGSARRLERLDLVSRPGMPNAITAGRVVSYLADYEVEIGEGAAISNPVSQKFLSGTSLDLTAYLTADGKGVVLEVRFMRSEHDTPIRRAETPMGSLEMPELRMVRLRTGLVVPLGRTVLVGVQGDGSTRRALLLSARLNRQP